MDLPNNEPVDLASLSCFLLALGQPSFRSAAAQAHLSPAAFGDRIARLEQTLGVSLFERTTRKVEATAAARRLRPQAEALLAAERELRRATVDERAPRPPFALTLGTRFELGLSWLLPALPALEAERPERALHLAFGDTSSLLQQLETRSIDAFVTSARLSRSGLSSAPLHEESYVFCGSTAHLDAEPLRGPQDALRHTLIDLRSDLPLFRYFMDAVPAEPSWRFADQRYLGTIAAARARVVEGRGVAVLPTYFVGPDIEAGTLTALCPEVPMPRDLFRLWWREGHPLEGELRQIGRALAERPIC